MSTVFKVICFTIGSNEINCNDNINLSVLLDILISKDDVDMQSEVGKIVIYIGILLLIVGVLIYFFGHKLSWIGHLPGDIRIEKENFKFLLPHSFTCNHKHNHQSFNQAVSLFILMVCLNRLQALQSFNTPI